MRAVTKLTAGSQIPLELYLYSTIPPFLARQYPYLQQTVTDPLQALNTVSPLDQTNHLSNASVMIPVADFPGVGHPYRQRPRRVIRRYTAFTEWTPAQGMDLQLAKYKDGIRDLERKKLVYKWHLNRTPEDINRERQEGFRRSGDPIKLPKRKANTEAETNAEPEKEAKAVEEEGKAEPEKLAL